uniref:Secreted protein n=1 Tax=Macrostomum lignano TaxID=282301 RepID=A0A1I8FH24_9PLAT
MSKMAAFNLLAAAALLCCIGCCTAQHGTYIGCYATQPGREPEQLRGAQPHVGGVLLPQCDRLRVPATSDCRTAALASAATPTACTGARASASANPALQRQTGTSFCGGRMRNCIYEIHREQCECDPQAERLRPKLQMGAPANQLCETSEAALVPSPD